MNDQNENIKCVVRIRPLVESEKRFNEVCIKKSQEDSNIILVESKSKMETKIFSFDHVFDEKIKQEDIFNNICTPLLDAFFQGYNCTIFAYGQTGSGKTHTMLGQPSSLFSNNETSSHGLIPRILNSIFSKIDNINLNNKKENKEVSITHTATINCSCLELYQEQFIDLLNENNSENLSIREDIKKGMYVEGVMEKVIDSVKSGLEIILLGLKNRHVAVTNMNAESSRSHLIFTIFLNFSTQIEGGLVKTRNSRLHLIDLAGSERQKSTGTIGERLKEAGMINKSLSTLGNVINALVENNNSDGKGKYVPFRDSKLTFFLKDSLGVQTTIVANISPCIINIQETLSTLKFVQRAKQIKNNAIINENVSGTLKSLQEEIKKLKEELLKTSQSECKNCSKKNTLTNSINSTAKNKTSEASCEENKNILFNKEDIKELFIKIDILLNFEKVLNDKLSNVGKLSKIFQEINSIRNIYKKESQTMFDDLEKKMTSLDLIFKNNENLLLELKTKSIDNKILFGKIDKLVLETSNFKSSLENNYDMYKLSLENKVYKNDLEQLKKQRSNEFLFIFNKQNIDIISSILNEFVETNNKIQSYFKDHIEIFIKDKKIENLLNEVDEYKLNEENMRKNIEELQNENFLLNMELQKYNESNHPKSDNEKYFALEKKLQKLNLSLNQKVGELKDKCNEHDNLFLEFQELKSKVINYEQIIRNDEAQINQQKEEIEILNEGNRIFENSIIYLNDKLIKKEKFIDDLLKEINHIQSLNKTNIEKNDFILNQVNELFNLHGSNINYRNDLINEIENLNKKIYLLNKVNTENKNDIMMLSNSFNENIFKQNTYFFEKDSFDDSVYKNYKRVTKSYSEIIISFKTNFFKLIEFYNNFKKNEKIIKVNLTNYMKHFDGKIEFFHKNFEKKINKQKEKISFLKKVILEKKFDFFLQFDVFKQLNKEVSLFSECKESITKKLDYIHGELNFLDKSSSNQFSNKSFKNIISSKNKTSTNLIFIKNEEIREIHNNKEQENKAEKLSSNHNKHEDDLYFTNDINKLSENETTLKVNLLQKFKEENNILRKEVDDLKRKIELMIKKMKLSSDRDNFIKTEFSSEESNFEYHIIKSQYEELMNKLFKLKVNRTDNTSEVKHEKAINLLKHLEMYFDIKNTKLNPVGLQLKNTKVKNIPEEQKKLKSIPNKTNISSDNIMIEIQKNKNKLEKNFATRKDSYYTNKNKNTNDPNKSFT